MPALLQIWIVIVTIGLLVIALLLLRRMNQFFDRTAAELSQIAAGVRDSAARIDLVACEARALTASLRDCVPPVLRVVKRFESLGHRTADLSDTLLEELELPVYAAAAVARGVTSGAGHLLNRLLNRFTQGRSSTNGGHDHE
jgi:hypothetical protein